MKVHAHDLIDAINSDINHCRIGATELILGHEAIWKSKYGQDLAQKIKESHKIYCGECDALPVLDLEKIAPISFKLPFDNCYFEFHLRKEHYVSILTERTEEGIVARLFAYNTDRSCWMYFPFYTKISDAPVDGAFLSVDTDYIKASVEAIKPYFTQIQGVIARFLKDERYRKAMESMGHTMESIKAQSMELVENFTNFPKLVADSRVEAANVFVKPVLVELYTFLSIMNCCNIERCTNKPDKALNKAKIKNRKCPEFSFSTIKLKGDTVNNMFGKHLMTGERAEMRLHWRRGHIKHRATGNFWWNAHVVGHEKEGTITSEHTI